MYISEIYKVVHYPNLSMHFYPDDTELYCGAIQHSFGWWWKLMDGYNFHRLFGTLKWHLRTFNPAGWNAEVFSLKLGQFLFLNWKIFLYAISIFHLYCFLLWRHKESFLGPPNMLIRFSGEFALRKVEKMLRFMSLNFRTYFCSPDQPRSRFD